jgi:hypothetical protein
MSQTIRNMDAATLAESRGGSDIASLIRQHGKSSKGSAHETEHIVR